MEIVMPSAHDHGNCELCDAIEAEIERLQRILKVEKASRDAQISNLEDEVVRVQVLYTDLLDKMGKSLSGREREILGKNSKYKGARRR